MFYPSCCIVMPLVSNYIGLCRECKLWNMSTGFWAKDRMRSSQREKIGGLVGNGSEGTGLGQRYSVNFVNSEIKYLFQFKYVL